MERSVPSREADFYHPPGGEGTASELEAQSWVGPFSILGNIVHLDP